MLAKAPETLQHYDRPVKISGLTPLYTEIFQLIGN